MPIHHFGNDPFGGFQTEYEQDHSPLNLHQEDSEDVDLAQQAAAEMVRISGAWVKVFARTDNGDTDQVFGEDPDPTYNPAVELKCYFKPQPMEFELKRWGVEAVNKTEVVFAISDLTQHWPSRMLRPGDVVELPYNHPVADLDPGFYRVVNATPDGNFRYGWLYFKCAIETLTADITVRPTDDMQSDITPDLDYQENGA